MLCHYDIKPENILLAEDGRAKVSDFGIAHVLHGVGGTVLSMTQTGFQPGTLVYMSPEQVLGKPVDARSDVYQVGELLYEMLAGKHYIDLAEIERLARDSSGNNSLRMQAKVFDLLADAICVKPTIALKPLRPDAPDELRGIIEAVLCKKTSERPTTANALASELRDYAQEKLPVALNDARVHLDLGNAYGMQGRWDDAISEYQAALRIDPNYATAYNNLPERRARSVVGVRLFSAVRSCSADSCATNCQVVSVARKTRQDLFKRPKPNGHIVSRACQDVSSRRPGNHLDHICVPLEGA